MNRSVYLLSADGGVGKCLISLGLAHVLSLKTARIAYFKPIADTVSEDSTILTILSLWGSQQPYRETTLFSIADLMEYAGRGNLEEIYTRVIAHYKVLESNYDFVIVEGISPHKNISWFERNFNVSLARNLNIPICFLLKDNAELSEAAFINNVLTKVREVEGKELNIVGVFINQCRRERREAILERLRQHWGGDKLVALYPFVPLLAKPTLFEIQTCLGAVPLYNPEKILSTIPQAILVGAMQLGNFLSRIQEDALVIIPGDRSDILLGCLLANRSPNFPNIAGIILSGNIPLERSIEQLLSLSPQNTLPILYVKKGTFESADTISRVESTLFAGNTRKINGIIDTFVNYTDWEALLGKISSFDSTEWVMPKLFQYNVLRLSKSYQRHIVLPEGDDDRVLEAAAMVANEGIARLTLLGDTERILDRVEKLSLTWDRARIGIVNPGKSPRLEGYAQELYTLRKHKGMDIRMARDLILDVSYFATMMVYKGDADGMVSGAKHTTAHTIKPALQFIKTLPNYTTVSSVFFMLLTDRVVVYGDCAIVPNPNAEQLAEIALNSAATALAFGIQPRVALLSYSSGSSGSGEDVDKVRRATSQVQAVVKKENLPYLVEGPIQYDAAVDRAVGRQKLPNSLVAGRANVLIFPDLNTGNNTYKAVQRESKSGAIGPILQGLRKPVNDLSRGALVSDIYNTIIITTIQAEEGAKQKPKS